MKIDEARDLEKKGGINKACSTLTSILIYQRELRAMAKSLERMTKKLNNTTADDALFNPIIRR